MRGQRLIFAVLMSVTACAGAVTLAQPGRGGSQWLTALADAQRTSWIRADDKISLAALSQPGFDQQWKVKLANQARGANGLAQGVTASGVTLFVPMSIVAGSSNNVFGLDNDIGHVVWQRHFDAPLPAATAGCAGGITSAATRIVKLDSPTAASASGFGGGRGRGNVGYRSLLGEPGEGVPAEGRAAGPPAGRGAPAGVEQGAARGAAPGARGAAPAPPPSVDRIPGSPRADENASPFAFLFRPSGVGYVISSDGMLHVLGLASGKDLQRPAAFLPANSKWSAPVAVDTMLYAATSGKCGGAPAGVWGIDLDSDQKPVVSWKTNGGEVVGAVAFTPEGTLIAAIGPGQATGDGKANAIVALDPKTLTIKDWFSQPTAEFVTGPTVIRHNNRTIVAVATKDGRIILLDAASLGGSNHDTPLAASAPVFSAGSAVSAEALAAWQEQGAGTSWILLPFRGKLGTSSGSANGPISSGAVVALKVVDAAGALSLTPGWTSHDLVSPATPLIVNGVVFTLATGASPAGRGGPAVLHAYDGATGKRLWTSAKSMSTPASPGSMWSGLGQIYVGLQDGTLHAFGFNDERRATNP